jgi:class 3 adenylate cyclase
MWGAAMDVGEWLKGIGLGQYEATFREHEIDADVLPELTEADLEKFGVPFGHRKRLIKAIAKLGYTAPEQPEAAPPQPAARSPSPRTFRPDAERRPITVMFCDLVGSTGLAAKLDPEDWRNLVNAYLDEASAAVTGFGGHVLKKLGDGLMALFGYPQAQENDAERAVRAALAIQRALAEINVKNRGAAPELLARIGIESGPVVVEANGEVFGDAPNVAARVQAAAEPGSVLVTMNVQRQTAGLFVAEDCGAHELKGVSEPVQLFRIVRGSGGGRRGGARALTPFVGREEELGLLARRWDRARAGEGRLVLIVGEPGLGKSRLIEEFRAGCGAAPHTWVEWSASQLLQNTPLHPIAEWGRLRFGADAPAEERLADLENTLRLIGLDPVEHAPLLAPLMDITLPPDRVASFPPEELRRKQLAAMTNMVLAGARSQPAVVAFEDLHWADPTSLDLLRGLAERGAQAPLLLLATTRPEFRPPWSLRSHHSVISLSPLDRAGVTRMVGEISVRHALSKEVIDGINERTGGVPLFVEEVTRLLVERGEQGGVQAIPPTLQQSLAARLDRLGPAREVAQIGAVLGRDFAYALLRDVAELDEPALQVAIRSPCRRRSSLCRGRAAAGQLSLQARADSGRRLRKPAQEPSAAAAPPRCGSAPRIGRGQDSLALGREFFGPVTRAAFAVHSPSLHQRPPLGQFVAAPVRQFNRRPGPMAERQLARDPVGVGFVARPRAKRRPHPVDRRLNFHGFGQVFVDRLTADMALTIS